VLPSVLHRYPFEMDSSCHKIQLFSNTNPDFVLAFSILFFLQKAQAFAQG
jgi:hypothetical protein